MGCLFRSFLVMMLILLFGTFMGVLSTITFHTTYYTENALIWIPRGEGFVFIFVALLLILVAGYGTRNFVWKIRQNRTRNKHQSQETFMLHDIFNSLENMERRVDNLEDIIR